MKSGMRDYRHVVDTGIECQNCGTVLRWDVSVFGLIQAFAFCIICACGRELHFSCGPEVSGPFKRSSPEADLKDNEEEPAATQVKIPSVNMPN